MMSKFTLVCLFIKQTKTSLSILENLVGLDSSYAENLQIVSYSIGGHYEPHVDYFNSIHADGDEDNVNTPNDRLSTMLFYLNEVEAGGATVFPLLNISVPPVAGQFSAVTCYVKLSVT